MKAPQILRKNVNALMESRSWTANKKLIEASGGRLSNGTLGRLREEGGENVRLNVVEELADVFGLEPHDMLAPDTSVAVLQPGLAPAVQRIAQVLALEMPEDVREDVGELLGKLAKRRGGTPELIGRLVSLLSAVEPPAVVPTQMPAVVDLDHAMSQDLEDASDTPSTRGESTEGTEQWKPTIKGKSKLGRRSGGSMSTTTSQKTPKETPSQEKRK